MIKFKKSILCVLLSGLIAFPLAGCSEGNTEINVKPEKMQVLSDGVIDSNNNYTLSWDCNENSALLKNSKTGDIWSTVPYDFYLQDDTNVNLNAPMFISYYSPSDGSLMTAKAYADCIELDNFSVASNEGIIKLEFYFDAAEILVPLEIGLTEKGMRVSLKAEDIKESGKTMLIDVSVLPYLCSAPNSEDKSSYLFVPTGSGALLYTDEDIQEFSRTYTGEVYGTDAARHILDSTTKEEPIRLPIYGVKNREQALLAIISEGAESAKITADAGNSRNGYSTVYATFSLRGNDETEVERTSYSDALIYSEEYDKDAVYTVNYYPLSGDKANYNGMAELYREYLSENGNLKDSSLSQQPYQLTFLGGSLVRDVAVGIPYMRMQTATDLEQAQSIVEELISETENTPSVLLKGYSEDGVDIGRIAGGYGFSSKLGGKKAYEAFKDYCEDNGITVFTEYDIVQFNSSSNGFSTSFDIAKTAGKQLAAFYPLRLNTRTKNESLKKTGLLQRSLLETAVEKLLKKCDYVSGISLTSLGSMAYSDYSDEEYYVKAGMSAQTETLINKAQNAGHTVNVGAANGYAAQVSDSISDVPLDHGEYFAFDEVIPFYQMIFHGISTMYSTPINLSADSAVDVLRAVESGVSPAFVLTSDINTALAETQSGEYYASNYEGNKEEIIGFITKTSDFFSKIGDTQIISYSILGDNASSTRFSNGTVVWVNRSQKVLEVDGKVLKGMSFSYLSDGKMCSCDLMGGDR